MRDKKEGQNRQAIDKGDGIHQPNNVPPQSEIVSGGWGTSPIQEILKIEGALEPLGYRIRGFQKDHSLTLILEQTQW